MATDLDIKESSTISFDKNGYRVERVALVTGATGTASQRLYNAINDLGMPNYGDAHPDISSITLQSIQAEPIDPETVRVTMSYYDDPAQVTTPASATVSASATTTTEEVTQDALGNRLEAYFTGSYAPLNSASYSQWWTAEIEVPRMTFDFEYTSATFPKTDIDTYMGKVNSVIWNGYAIKTILCTAINVFQSGSEYRVRFSFAYNADTWRFVGAVKGPNLPLTAHPTITDAGINLTTGLKSFDVYDTVDFAPLGFTL